MGIFGLRFERLNSWVYLAGCSIDKSGKRMLTPDCVTPSELEYWIDQLIEDLLDQKKTVRRRYKRAEKKASALKGETSW